MSFLIKLSPNLLLFEILFLPNLNPYKLPSEYFFEHKNPTRDTSFYEAYFDIVVYSDNVVYYGFLEL